MASKACVAEQAPKTEFLSDDVFHGLGDAAGRGGGGSHAGTRRCFWTKAHRAASLAHVLWAVHRSRVFFPGTLKPSAAIAFDSGARKASIPAFIQHRSLFNSQHTSPDFADFLASPSSLQKYVHGKFDTSFVRKF
jgi:hypothetical protein